MKRYEKYRPTGSEWIGEIPEHWEICHLRWFSKVYSGYNSKDTYGSFPLFGANGIIGKCNNPSYKDDKIVIGRVGSSGEINYASGVYGVSDNALVVDHNEDIFTKYLFYLLKIIDFSNDITLNAQPLLTATNVKNKYISIPPLEEQSAIANYLNEKTAQIDTLIANKQKLIELLKEESTAIINQAVTKGIDPNVKLKPQRH